MAEGGFPEPPESLRAFRKRAGRRIPSCHRNASRKHPDANGTERRWHRKPDRQAKGARDCSYLVIAMRVVAMVPTGNATTAQPSIAAAINRILRRVDRVSALLTRIGTSHHCVPHSVLGAREPRHARRSAIVRRAYAKQILTLVGANATARRCDSTGRLPTLTCPLVQYERARAMVVLSLVSQTRRR